MPEPLAPKEILVEFNSQWTASNVNNSTPSFIEATGTGLDSDRDQLRFDLNKGDVVIGISTSGSSTNVINALGLAKKIGCETIGFSGRDGGEMNTLYNVNIVVPSDDTPRIQEIHILIGHTICQIIDQKLFNE